MRCDETELIFMHSRPGRIGVVLPQTDVPLAPLPKALLRDSLSLPEVDELTVVRHFTQLSQKNFSIDTEFYPLGSCTMKYNPKINEVTSSLSGFRGSHPLLNAKHCQGGIELIYNLQESLQEISGFDVVSCQPAAGAHGELAGVFMIRKYHHDKGDTKRTKILIPDSAHGTNPASCTMAGLEAITIPSDSTGGVDLAALQNALDETVAGIMITNPNTLGLFDRNIEKICDMVHKAGGLVYGDGANMNAMTGILKPASIGIDVMHFNLHKTFATPHGGGGPGVGAVGAVDILKDYLPGPLAIKTNEGYSWKDLPKSIGRMKMFNGNFSVLVRAYTYILSIGADGLKRVAENAVLNANYIRVLIERSYTCAYPKICTHEFVVMGDIAPGIRTLDIAKRLIDYGFHPPTIYFPLIVHESIMIEPTETESRETLEQFATVLCKIAEEARTNPELLHEAPHNTPIGRLDEVSAARNPSLCYKC